MKAWLIGTVLMVVLTAVSLYSREARRAFDVLWAIRRPWMYWPPVSRREFFLTDRAPLPMSAGDRQSARRWLIGSALFALPAAYELAYYPPQIFSTSTPALLFLLTQFPLMLAFTLLADSIHRRLSRTRLTGGHSGRRIMQSRTAIVEPPRFEEADGRAGEIHFTTPLLAKPPGPADVTVRIHVTNPNPFGVTLRALEATLFVEELRAARCHIPLAVPLGAWQESDVSIGLSIDLAEIPELAGVMLPAAIGNAISYRLDGTVSIDAGPFGQQTFRRQMLGELRVASGG